MHSYFTTCKTVEEVKKLYRTLAMKHHPDRGGDTATMQELNAQYHAALNRMDGSTSRGTDNKEHTYHYNQEHEQEIMNKIHETLAKHIIKDSVELWLIGTWVWVQGDTKPIKEELKSLGYQWHSKRSCWYWQNDGHKHRFNSKANFGDLAYKYGATSFKSKEQEAIA